MKNKKIKSIFERGPWFQNQHLLLYTEISNKQFQIDTFIFAPFYQEVKVTHVSLLIKLVIGQFNFIEWNHLSHPLLTKRGRIRVNINASWHRCVCISRHDPLRAVVCISVWKKITNEHTTGKGNPQSEKPDFTRYKSIPIADQNPVIL